MNIFDMMNMSLEEIQAANRDLFAKIVAEEAEVSYLSTGNVLPLDYYRYFGRQFDADEWKKKVTV